MVYKMLYLNKINDIITGNKSLSLLNPLSATPKEGEVTEIILSQLPKSRKEAKEKNSKYYYTGVCCSNGHLSYRYTSSLACSVCQREYWENNKEKCRAFARKSAKKWYHLNKNKINKEKRSAYQKEWYQKNKEKVKSYSYDWRLKNPEKNKKSRRISESKRRAVEGNFNKNQLDELFKKQKYKCFNCLKSVRKKYHIDHIIPLYLGGTNWIENIQILCPKCNLSKGKDHPIDWAQKNGKLL